MGVSIIRTNGNPPPIPTTSTLPREANIREWSCILMVTSHYRSWNTSYMYKADLLWVWRGWVASIIRTNRYPPSTQRPRSKGKEIHSQVLEGRYQGMAASLWPLAIVAGAQLHYIYKADLVWVWTGYGAPIITYSTLHVTNQVNHLLLLLLRYCHHEVRPSVGVASVWPLTTVEGAEILYICMRQTFYEYDLGGLPQS